MKTFDEPKSHEECDSRISELRLEVESIRNQLGSKSRRGADGERLSTKDFFQWRDKALGAKAAKSSEIRFLQDWKESQNKESKFEKCPVSVKLLYGIMKNLKEVYEDVGWEEVTDEEQEMYDSAKEFLLKEGFEV